MDIETCDLEGDEVVAADGLQDAVEAVFLRGLGISSRHKLRDKVRWHSSHIA